MAQVTRTPRSRGTICGLILIVLGAWGGLIPFVGPYFKYGFTPDKTWAYTQGRLYLSVVPGIVALLAGLVIVMTRGRGFGGFCAFVAALAGAWFIGGSGLVLLLPASFGAASISTGTPIATSTSGLVVAELGFYSGIGALIVFFAALALGRFSIAAAKDAQFGDGLSGAAGVAGAAGAGGLAYDAYQHDQDQPAQQPYSSSVQVQYPSGQSAFPADQYPAGQDQYPAGQDQYPATHEQQTTTGTFPAEQDPFPPTRT